MSGLLGPMLGFSPFFGCGTSAEAITQATQFNAALANTTAGLVKYGRCPYCGGATPLYPGRNALSNMAPSLPEPGIHWTQTGGKSWRVLIVR